MRPAAPQTPWPDTKHVAFSEQRLLQHNVTNLCMEQNKAYLASTCDSTVTDGNIVANGASDLGLCRERKEVERQIRK